MSAPPIDKSKRVPPIPVANPRTKAKAPRAELSKYFAQPFEHIRRVCCSASRVKGGVAGALSWGFNMLAFKEMLL
jgi:hypothetical protein